MKGCLAGYFKFVFKSFLFILAFIIVATIVGMVAGNTDQEKWEQVCQVVTTPFMILYVPLCIGLLVMAVMRKLILRVLIVSAIGICATFSFAGTGGNSFFGNMFIGMGLFLPIIYLFWFLPVQMKIKSVVLAISVYAVPIITVIMTFMYLAFQQMSPMWALGIAAVITLLVTVLHMYLSVPKDGYVCLECGYAGKLTTLDSNVVGYHTDHVTRTTDTVAENHDGYDRLLETQTVDYDETHITQEVTAQCPKCGHISTYQTYNSVRDNFREHIQQYPIWTPYHRRY